MLRTPTVLLLACLALSPTTLAAECNGEITKIIVEDGSPGGQGFYVDDRTGGGTTINHWIYKEDNGVEGLQSGGCGLLDSGIACYGKPPDPLPCCYLFIRDFCFGAPWGQTDLYIV